MDLEKLGSRARFTLLVVSLVGVLITALGVLLALTIISREGTVHGGGGDWVIGLSQSGGPVTLAAIGALIACIPWALWPLANLLYRRALDSRFRGEQIVESLESQRQTLERIREVASLSDAAKQVAYRAQDLEALRSAIREDMNRGDFEAAMMLANEMEQRFGYAQEADKFRDQINTTSRAAIEARIRETAERVEVLVKRFEWATALRECARAERQFPDHPEVRKISERIQGARDSHKRDLLKDWKEAVARDDVERSVGLLKELDQYLSPLEAEAYKESARDVFRKRLQQLGVQFALHVHDKNWGEALRIGREITDEYPNTRMAAEVRERMAILQDKAQQPVGV